MRHARNGIFVAGTAAVGYGLWLVSPAAMWVTLGALAVIGAMAGMYLDRGGRP